MGKLTALQADAPFVEDVEDIYETASCAYCTTLPDGRIVKVNRTFLEWTGRRAEEVLYRQRFEDFLTAAGRLFYQTHFIPLLHLQGNVSEVTLDLATGSGGSMRVLVNTTQKRDEDGRLLACRTILFSALGRLRYEEAILSARREAEEMSARLRDTNRELVSVNARLHDESERLQVTLGSIADGVIATDEHGRIRYLNPPALRMCGWTADEAAGRSWTEVFRLEPDVLPARHEDPVAWAIAYGTQVTIDSAALASRGGTGHFIHGSVSAIRAHDGRVVGAILVLRDISTYREMTRQMTYLAQHDAMTGLINRTRFDQELQSLLDAHDVASREHALLYIDLDQFKVVNDTCGHAVGDHLLKQVATLMQGHLRGSDLIGRLGGDEFGVLLRDCRSAEALVIANRIRQAVADFRFVALDKVFPIGTSIGLVAFGGCLAGGTDILRLADAACYVAKDLGRNRVHVYTPDDAEFGLRETEMDWVGRVRRALEEERLVLYTQAIVPLHPGPGHRVHHEVLLRMVNEDGSPVPPMAFIPAAERYGLMPAIDRWVVRTTLQHCTGPAADPHAAYAINLSGMTMGDDGFLDFVRDAFAATGVAPGRICFEVTETAAIANLARATMLIERLRALGCRFALDDFGSGMSSFSYFKHLPVDYLKIDGAFIRNIVDNHIDHAMVEAINHVGHVMGLQTVAEFVESDEAVRLLRALGVDYAEGYGISRPLPIALTSTALTAEALERIAGR